MIRRSVSRNGLQWWVADHEPAFWDRVENGTWEPETFNIFDRFLDTEHSYIDIGAWIGPTVLYGASLTRHCYALEPDPIAFSRLLENVELNASILSRISISQQCLAVECGPVLLGNKTSAVGGDSMSSLLFAGSEVNWEVQGVTLDRFLSENAIHDCSFIKMDIEGGEFVVLPAIADYLASHRPTLYLSLHPRFLPDAELRVGPIAEILACYRHAYTATLNEVGPSFVRDPSTFHSCYELILSDVDYINGNSDR